METGVFLRSRLTGPGEPSGCCGCSRTPAALGGTDPNTDSRAPHSTVLLASERPWLALCLSFPKISKKLEMSMQVGRHGQGHGVTLAAYGTAGSPVPAQHRHQPQQGERYFVPG